MDVFAVLGICAFICSSIALNVFENENQALEFFAVIGMLFGVMAFVGWMFTAGTRCAL